MRSVTSARLSTCIDDGLFRRRAGTLRRVGTRAALLCLLASVLIPLAPSASSAAGQTVVSLEFDDASASQYTLGYTRALQPHAVNATFFVKSGTVGGTGNMTWTQVTSLASAGNDVGGKTVNSANLTTDADPTSQVCNDRQALIQHGLNPVTFAYPGGAYNSSVQTIVKNCGYGNGRGAGGVSASGPTYAETIPPANFFATKTWTPPTSASTPTQLSDMQTEVNAAASHGGGWVQIILYRICSQTFDPNNYTSCLSSSRPVQLDTVNGFLDWMQNAGQTGGAPAGATLNTARNTITGSDTTAPTTTISCNGAACSTSVYSSAVSVTFAATDTGSGVASTHYTTDGSTPSLSSPTYTGAFAVTSTTTVNFRSWDNAGNVEATKSQLIQAAPPPDAAPPVTTIRCNGATCGTAPYDGSVTVSLTATDNAGGWGVDKTYYTTDGSTPTTSSTVYSGAFQLSSTVTVRFFSTDLAGNAEQPQSQQIQVQPPLTVVSLTFDDGDKSQYSLAFQHALKPHNIPGTFYINTGNLGSAPNFMTWSDLTDLAANGDEVGGHTVHHIDMASSSYTQQQKIDEVCNDRQALFDHGLSPISFAYPYGSYNTNAESIVQGCGYTTARRTGGLPLSGPPYAETIPPADKYATRAWTASTPETSPLQLSDMQNGVMNTASHGGGWHTIVIHEVCSQTYAPSSYSACLADFRPIELDTLNAFLDWLQNVGNPGGAPPRTTVQTVGNLINGPDTTPPTTSILCNGSPCSSAAYTGSVAVTLQATDQGGSGVGKTYYTTDGSTPTQSSPGSSGSIAALSADTTVKFFSVDNAGNVEQVRSQLVQVNANADPVVATAGDIACDPLDPAFNNGDGTATSCRAKGTSALLAGADAVLPLGDDQYNCGGSSAFAQSYDPTWGRFKSITYPVPGDKDYATSGGTDCPPTPGAGYYSYFGSRAGDPSKGYYSYDLGAWHVIALNTAPCPADNSFCAAGSAQEQWLQNDLAANSSACTLAYFQNPRFASRSTGGSTSYAPFWK